MKKLWLALLAILGITLVWAQADRQIDPETKEILSGRSEIKSGNEQDEKEGITPRWQSRGRTRSEYAAGRTSNAPGSSNTTPTQGGNTFGTQGNPLPEIPPETKR